MSDPRWWRRPVALTLALCAPAFVVACGGSGSQDDGNAAGSSDEKLVLTTPTASGTVAQVNWGLAYGEPTTLDPAKAGDFSPNTVVANLCDNLLRLQPDYSVKPGIAEKYEQVDPKTLVFTIRSGVKFWDGKSLTPDDVVYSLTRQMDPATQAVNAQAFASVASIKATGTDQVTVKFKAPDASFLSVMSGVAGAISEQAFTEKAGKRYGTAGTGVMCSGPFKFDRWTSGQQIDVSANPDYWDASLKPKVQRLTFKFLADSGTLTSALQSGELDGAYEAPLTSLRALRNSKVGKLYTGPSTQSLSAGPTTDSGPAADPRVRQALDLAIDKTAFVKNVLRGAGQPLKTFTPPFTYSGSPAKAVYQKGYDALPDTSEPNMAEAKRLIAEAKPEKKPLTIAVVAGVQAANQVATVLQATGKSLGLDMRIKQMQSSEFSQLFYDPSKRASTDFVVANGYIEAPNVLSYAPLFAVKGGLFNWSGFSDPAVAADLAAAREETDPTQSAESFVKAQATFAKARLQISFATVNENLFMNNKITGAPASFAYINSPWAASLGASGAN